MARLTSDFRARALIRRVHDAGGSATVLAKGDAISGAILVLALERDGGAAFYERGLGRYGLIRSGPRDSDPQHVDDYWRRRRWADPDLWVIELSVASAERFAAETIAID